VGRNHAASDVARQYDYSAIGLLANRLGADTGMIAQSNVDPAPFECRHWLELQHLAGLHDALCGAYRKITQLSLAATPIVLDVDQDPRPVAHAPRKHQVDEVLQGREAFALATDERAKRLAFLTRPDDVQPARLAGLDFYLDGEAKVRHQLLEDGLTRRECFGRRFGRLEIGAFRCQRAASSGDFRLFTRGEA
jgi:hypothetical protein